jgi:hypothetical protein
VSWTRSLEAMAPLAGIAAVLLIVVGGLVIDSGDTPADNAPAAAYLAYFEDETGSIWGGGTLLALGAICFLWFAGSVRAWLAAAEGPPHRLSSLALAGATGMAVLVLGAVGTTLSGAIAADEDVRLTPDAAQAIYVVGQGLFLVAWMAAAVFLLATAVAALRTAALPRWLAWATLAIGVLLLIPWVGWAAFLFLLPLWIVVVAILLWRAAQAPG